MPRQKTVKSSINASKTPYTIRTYFLDDGAPSQDFIQSRDDIEKPQTTSALILLRCKNNYAKFLT